MRDSEAQFVSQVPRVGGRVYFCHNPRVDRFDVIVS